MKRIAMVGKLGPMAGDRPSAVHIETADAYTRVTNWPTHDRTDALRVAFDAFTNDDIHLED